MPDNSASQTAPNGPQKEGQGFYFAQIATTIPFFLPNWASISSTSVGAQITETSKEERRSDAKAPDEMEEFGLCSYK